MTNVRKQCRFEIKKSENPPLFYYNYLIMGKDSEHASHVTFMSILGMFILFHFTGRRREVLASICLEVESFIWICG